MRMGQFPILWPHPPVQMKLSALPPGFEIVQYKSYSIQLKTAYTLNFCPRHFRNKVHRLGTVISGTIRMFRCCHCITYPMRRQVSIHAFCSLLTAFLRKMSEQNLLSLTALQLISDWVNHQLPPVK